MTRLVSKCKAIFDKDVNTCSYFLYIYLVEQTSDIHGILKEYWGYSQFRPLQEDVIRSVLEGNDTLALMPTGGGKSVCYQVPGLALEGLCLVISPLIALMKDQVAGLKKKSITAFSIFSGMSRKEVESTLQTVINSNCKFLFVSPERLETQLFKEYLPAMRVGLIAVDEAHCISQWGYDFRPPYLRIGALRDDVQHVPILALTASATQEVQDDICDKLRFKNKKVYRSSFARANLSYSAFKVDSKINKISEILTRVPGSGLVYCKSRKRTKEIAELLQMQGIAADFYHAGLSQDERNRKQEEWIDNKTRIIACTNAFGMGIDKPDVRVVVHADVPDCLENYYQEAGRAGRDRNKSYAALLFDEKEINELRSSPHQRFPPPEEIKKIYAAIVNYLQIPTGAGAFEYYDFDIGDFVAKFKLSSFVVANGLKTLEQEGWLSFNEQVFVPSSVTFTTDKNYLFQYEEKYPQEEPLIKSLLRTYEGIFDFPVFISEFLLAKICGRHIDDIRSGLSRLHKQGVIRYEPQKDSPQVYMLRERVRIEEFRMNTGEYERRKNRYTDRINEMIGFTREVSTCRSKIIGNYFGDTDLKDCGICDNCLRKKKRPVTKKVFNQVHERIMSAIPKNGIHSKDLINQLPGIPKEHLWSVIEFLQGEKWIELDKKGWVRIIR